MINYFKQVRWARIIRKSGLLDEDFYLLSYPEVRSLDIDPIEHYVKFGAAEGRNPSAGFNTNLYVQAQGGIDPAVINPLVHYILHGQVGVNENCLPQNAEARCEKDVEIIRASGLFDSDYYRNTYPDMVTFEGDPLWHFAYHGWREGRNPNRHFETQAYINAAGRPAEENPLVHYITSNILPVAVEVPVALPETMPEVVPDSGSDEHVISMIKSLNMADGPKMIEFIKNKLGTIKIEGFFSSEDYLELYPDIREAQINPLLHFLQHGRAEGRIGFIDLSSHIKAGGKVFDSGKETVVLVTHESSATGAPLLGFGIADKLADRYNIVHIVLREKNIHEAFLSNCDTILSDIEANPYTYSLLFLKVLLQQRSIKCVLINSVVGYKVMYAAHKLSLPVVFLIHEFAEYMRPLGTMIDAVLHSDVLVTPATIIQSSIQKEFRRLANHKKLPSNMHILPQGKLPYIPDTYGDDSTAEQLYKRLGIATPDEFKIIVGSGWVQTRKGVDLFISTARYLKQLYGGQCKFVWVGEGFDPDNDLAYSVYLEREIEFSGLGEDFVLLEHQKNLDAIFSIADVFCLSSRMDPFPNVVIDALSHDLHVACFDDASGSAEFLRKHDANCTIVDFVDTHALARGICHYLQEGNHKPGRNLDIVRDHLDFNQYVGRLDEFITEAVAFRKKCNAITHDLLESRQLDTDFIGAPGSAEEKCRRYVESALKGMHFYNPKVGFSELGWLDKHSPGNDCVVPLYEALRAGSLEQHAVLRPAAGYRKAPRFTYAVHLHLYYTEMAGYFAQYFSNLSGHFDLYITIVNEADQAGVELEFRECGAARVEVVVVENIGRDIGPFIFALKDKLLSGQYEVVGHFHSKKSLDVNEAVGDKWCDYLMGHLIGTPENACNVLSLFNDAQVGLVFPEDTNTCDIGENSAFVADLCGMLALPAIRQTPIFPMGNMFWARMDAIRGLFTLDPQTILQSEPLPYDGTHLHALERITPHLIESRGYRYSTVYIDGMTWK